MSPWGVERLLRGPAVEERKRKLDGRVLRYPCVGLEVAPERAVLGHVLTRTVELHGILLPAGTCTYGVFWSARPYNVYQWVDPGGVTLALYCNAATDTRIGPEAVEWLDLEVDVLLTPDGRVRVVDEHEVPTDLAPEHRRALRAALGLLRAAEAVAAEVEAITRRYRAG
jgi:predicted RNA-binding protein associated with RNAse of E/G family